MQNNPESIDNLPMPIAPRQNPKWVGLVMAWFLPGSAHFLSGQRRMGVLLYFVWLILGILPFFPLSGSGVGFFYIGAVLTIIFILFLIVLLISSWRPTQRLGCFGWILFVGVVLFEQSVIVLPCALLMKTYVVELYTINGMSMSPMLIAPSEAFPNPKVKQSDRIIANKWIYRMSDPKRGDIVIFKAPGLLDSSSTTNYAKRIVGLPGETIDIESPYVLINGERLTDPPIFAKIADKQDGYTGYCTVQDLGVKGNEGVVSLPLTLGADEYFLLGDNSQHSLDSRFRGAVRRQDITGKVVRVYYPFNRIREIE
jgi:signal peptidase I